MRERKSRYDIYKKSLDQDPLHQPIFRNRSHRVRNYRSRIRQIARACRQKPKNEELTKQTKENVLSTIQNEESGKTTENMINMSTPRQQTTATKLEEKFLKQITLPQLERKSMSLTTQNFGFNPTQQTKSGLKENSIRQVATLRHEQKSDLRLTAQKLKEKSTKHNTTSRLLQKFNKSLTNQKFEKNSTIANPFVVQFEKRSSMPPSEFALTQTTNNKDILKINVTDSSAKGTTALPTTPSSTPKLKIHIHPCICDLSPSQLSKIREYNACKKASKKSLYERIHEIREMFHQKEAEREAAIKSQKEQMKDVQEMTEEVEDKYMREQIQRIKIIKKKPKRPPKVDKKIKKFVLRNVRRRRKPPKPYKLLVGMRLRLNYRNSPKIPVKMNRTSILRKSHPVYCEHYNHLLPKHKKQSKNKHKDTTPKPIDFRILPEVELKQNRTYMLRIEKTKARLDLPPPVYKYDRPSFESCIKSLRFIQRKTVNTKGAVAPPE